MIKSTNGSNQDSRHRVVNVLIVDDSSMVREILKEIFSVDPEIKVVGEAVNGREAVELTRRLQPHIITMDVQMPVMDGFQATEQIMGSMPTPILIFSSAIDKTEQYTSFKAISLGALENMSKPDITQQGFDEIAGKLRKKVKLLSHINVIRHIRGKLKNKDLAVPVLSSDAKEKTPPPDKISSQDKSRFDVIAVGTSTGGPMALKNLLSQFPAHFPVGIVVVQHITSGFTESFVEWLDSQTQLKIKIAVDGEEICGGTVYISPSDVQLMVDRYNCIILDKHAPPWGEFKPAVNTLFQSVGKNIGDKAIGIILTGMGNDGASGLKYMRENGAITIGQDESTSLIFGMPKAAIENKAVQKILPLDEIPRAIIAAVKE